ncbi:MAG: hypothetical protein WC627_08845 [Legionella sp.]|jgi:hypothetical protein
MRVPTNKSRPTIGAVNLQLTLFRPTNIDSQALRYEIQEEWSTELGPLITNLLGIKAYYLQPFNDKHRLYILSEKEARALLKSYSDGCFLIFKKENIHYLLSKNESGLKQYTILNKSSTLNRLITYEQRVKFNLKDENGDLLFNDEGVTATSLYSFLFANEFKQKFPFFIDLKGIYTHSDISLQKIALRSLVIHEPILSLLPELPDILQDTALEIFLKTFLSGIDNYDINTLIENNLFNNYRKTLNFRKHYSVEQIKTNLGYLRTLYDNGNTKAACLLAMIVYSGLCEQSINNEITFTISESEKTQTPPIIYDLEEFKKITQNPAHFPEKIVRDLFLLKYYTEKRDHTSIDSLRKEIDINQAILMPFSFCNDYPIIECIKLQGYNSIKSIGNTQLLYHLIQMGRELLASKIISELSDDVIQAKDETGNNILHFLINYLLINKNVGSKYIIDLFKHISDHFPEMLTEQDNQGYTVYDNIQKLKPEVSVELYQKVKSIIDTRHFTAPRI